ncbi:MAG TPA: tetratricopeptide repeat protein [Thermoanaerobaculia bacterium]|nr:tetratricopeptide repeat protein [Thermoanaerobaculia bacterium]
MSDKVVSFERAHRRPDPARVQEFAETARRLQRERQESVDVVTRALRETPSEEWPRLATRPELRNSGALNRLEAEVSSRLEKEPQEALLISDLAASIAETLPPDSYPAVVLAQLRAHAWKDRAQALAYIGRYPEALEALDRAEQQLTFGSLAHDRAIVRYVRALTLQKVNRFEESRAMLAECAQIFRDHGDARLQLFCGIAQGIQLFRERAFRDAYDVFAPLLSVARQLKDIETEARVQNNLGHCAAELGDFTAANVHLSQATAAFTELGRTFEAIRTEMTFGRLLVNRGAVAMGMQRLHDARRSFLMHEMVEDAGMCGLELVELYLISEDVAEAVRLAREIAQQFLTAGLNERAQVALGYLNEALTAHLPSIETVRHVRSYIAALRDDPTREFAAM